MFRNYNAGTGLFVLRVIVGIIFLNHGLGKLVGPPFAGPGIDGTIGFFGSIGLPSPVIAAWGVGILATLGGLGLILGAGVGIFGLLLAADMAVAAVKVHLAAGFDVYHFGNPTARGYEYVLVLCAACVALALGGPGIMAVQLRPKN